ncbi:MAG: transcription-repair coupling factor [Prevotella sp.]|nr:transcription-repair coupling factor [Prevotella sp.]
MEIKELQALYSYSPKVKALEKAIGKKSVDTIALEGLLGSSAAVIFSALKSVRPFVFIMQDAEEAGYYYHDLTQLMGESHVLFFPSSYRRAIKYGQKDPASEILRTEVLSALNVRNSKQEPSPLYVVSYPEALAEMVVTRRQLDTRTLSLEQGQVIDNEELLESLRTLGFREVDYVYEPGQFALRGSILDIFSYSHEYPFRIDFFDDEIDSIRTFEVENQLSRERKQRVDIVPELTSETQKESLMKFLPDDAMLVFKDYTFIRESIEQIYQDGFSQQAIKERLETATEQEARQIEQDMHRDSQMITGTQFASDSERFRTIELKPTASSMPGKQKASATISFSTSFQPLFHKNFDLLKQSLDDYLLKGFKLYILADSTKQIERLKDILETSDEKATATKRAFMGVNKTLHEGFVDNDLKLCLFTDHQIFDRFHKYNLKSDKARSGKVALTLKEIQQFEIGDFVVHVDHGIGKFGGLVRMPITSAQGTTSYQEMIKIIYQRGDAIYVSIHALYKVSKYKSQDGGQQPRLSTLGTGQWERLKERTKKHIKDIARDLIKLYATRRHQRGFAFSHDTYLQHELEASFLYEDTPDQLKATQDVKADMEKSTPMDRLVCGDVGFGKTEVAVRAAFKAAVDGKQVAVMVPTTVLAYQHYHTFVGRLKDMPVRVDYLTRARTAKQTTQLLADLEAGKIDILIGTHKLIGKKVKFHDLGLLIIDEEQKFGVSTKEKLRQMKTNVDTLTMSATPIPRTLQFSLVGARDLSVIQTPPPNRYPIQTEIHTFSAEIVTDAINFEMSRNGQVFFVNNRIGDLARLKEMILKYIPDCRVAVGHGQMKPDELEKIVLDFSNYDYDVLLSTTIVENGIDIPNANTIIINGAHYFGLSDLHQMRGRVGRGNRKAFCYLLAPPLAALPVDSRRRLEALENFSELGSGINIAMQDLDIRGAGNLLGAEQSGFISDLGYETYQKILNEAMTELRNEEIKDAEHTRKNKTATGNVTTSEISFTGDYVSDCMLDSDLEMYFPDSYVPSDSERMLLYRELDNIRDDNELEAYHRRMIDRFGKMPTVAEELLHVVPLRRLGKQLGCEKIMLKQGRMFLHFVSVANSPYYQSGIFDRIIDYATHNTRRCILRENATSNGIKRSMVIANVDSVGEAVNVLKQIEAGQA